jgi:6-phosphogluconolactonase
LKILFSAESAPSLADRVNDLFAETSMTYPWTRRSLLIASAATVAARYLQAVDNSTGLVYMSSSGAHSSGIHAGRWNAKDGTLSGYRSVSNISTDFLALTHHREEHFLYAGHQVAPNMGGLSAFRILASGDLTLLNTVTAPEASFSHLACDRTGRCIVAPNYAGGFTLSAKIAPDGRLSEFVSRIEHEGRGPVADRQSSPHPHGVAISPNNRFAYINDLGADRIFVFRLDVAAGEIVPADPPFFIMPAGSGPRHLAFHPNGRWAYSVNELNSTLTLFHWNPATGALTTVATTPTLAPGGDVSHNRAGEIAFDAAGRFLYTCNRGAAEELPIFAVGDDGHLTFIARTPLEGKEARHFVVSPDDGYLLVANQFSNAITVFARDRGMGLLKLTSATYPLEGASCVLFS